ncbi:MAG TPA: hypothetical protein VJQ54_20260 [Candidatus Sulfotelmatobacter sp.]|nr:hypothetical protein [Candidatus Sulfotelmatobacter sp.]
MRGAPQPGFSRHIWRIRARIWWEIVGRPGWPRRTLQLQNRAKAGTMPGHDRFGPDDGQGRTPVAPGAGQPDPQQAVRWGQFRAFFRGALKHADLVAQSQVL